MRLKKSELAPPVRGVLSVVLTDGRGMSFKRPSKMAYLKRRSDTSVSMMVDALQPMFDVELITLDEAITLKGLDLRIDPATKRVYEIAQIWRCVPVVGGA